MLGRMQSICFLGQLMVRVHTVLHLSYAFQFLVISRHFGYKIIQTVLITSSYSESAKGPIPLESTKRKHLGKTLKPLKSFLPSRVLGCCNVAVSIWWDPLSSPSVLWYQLSGQGMARAGGVTCSTSTHMPPGHADSSGGLWRQAGDWDCGRPQPSPSAASLQLWSARHQSSSLALVPLKRNRNKPP